MHVPLSLLQTYFSVPLRIKDLLSACDRIGIEAEVLIETSASFSSVITAKILQVCPHPNADKLKVATLFDGSQEYQIVCGAPNCREGIVIPLALPGAKLTDSQGNVLTIKKSKIRGVESQGMCCGADELGLPEELVTHGLLELANDTPLGEDVATIFSETILEISLTPNLGHCASLFGLAREISHVTSAALTLPKEFSLQPMPLQEVPSRNDFSVCPLFCYIKISGIPPASPSPAHLQNALRSLKQKSVNALVDVTNYLMFSLGQPLHAYDARSVHVGSLHVQYTESACSLTLLNNETVMLPKQVPVVCDDERILALAGVMGSLESAVSDETTEIILEGAYFPPEALRASQNLVPIHSEASYRFSRGVDYNNVVPAFFAAIHYLKKMFPEAEFSPIYVMGEAQRTQKTLLLRASTVERILGETLTTKTIHAKLSSLGFPIREETAKHLRVEIPSYRHDIQREIDLVEEVFRTQSWHVEARKPMPCYTSIYKLKRHLVDLLANSGLQQFFTCDLLKPELAALCDAEHLITLQGSKHATALRPSLLPGLLESTATNLNRQAGGVYAFELGAVYKKVASQYQETQTLGILLSGQAEAPSWLPSQGPLSFFSIKSWIEKILNHLGISSQAYTLEPSNHAYFHPYQQGLLRLHKHTLGFLGTVHPKLTKKMQIKHPVFFGELSVDLLNQGQKKTSSQYVPYPIYPSSFRDVTLAVPEELPADALRKELLRSPSKWLERVSIISIYQNKASSNQEKHVSLRLVFQDRKRTLSNQEIDEEYERLVSGLTQRLKDKGMILT